MMIIKIVFTPYIVYDFTGPGHEKIVSWIKRLEIAEDAAKG